MALAALLVLGVLAVFTLRQLVAGARAMGDAERALAAGDRAEAISAARAAAEAAVPGSPYPTRGFRLLEQIAREAEARGEDEISNRAFRAMRAAALETRGVGAGTDRPLAVANEGLARVGGLAAGEPRSPGDPRLTEEQLLAMLQRDDTPGTGTFVLLSIGLAAFFVGAGRLVWLAGGTITWTGARWPGLLTVVGLVAWALAALR